MSDTNPGEGHAQVVIEPVEATAARAVICHPGVYPSSMDDFSPPAEEFDVRAMLQVGCGLLGAYASGRLIGVFVLRGHSRVMWEVHTCILPEARGAVGEAAAKALIAHVFAHGCKKLITLVPKFNRPALLYALRAGLRVEGNLKASFQKGGELHDQILLSVNKEQLCL